MSVWGLLHLVSTNDVGAIGNLDPEALSLSLSSGSEKDCGEGVGKIPPVPTTLP